MTETSRKSLQQAAPQSDDDYGIIEQALLQNPQGKWFLEEYLKRNRPDDTKKLLSAIERIENRLTGADQPKPADIDPIRMSIIEMANAIAKTREEISSIKPANEDQNQLTNASEELSAIVTSTEDATNTILEAAEEIQEAAWILREAGADEGPCDQIDTRTTEIYTACSFQDITGQRTNKVVQALTYIENRVNAMIDIWGLNEMKDNQPVEDETNDARPDAHLLNGPAKPGEELVQNDIDDVLENPSEAKSGPDLGGQDFADSLSFDQFEDQADLAEPDNHETAEEQIETEDTLPLNDPMENINEGNEELSLDEDTALIDQLHHVSEDQESEERLALKPENKTGFDETAIPALEPEAPEAHSEGQSPTVKMGFAPEQKPQQTIETAEPASDEPPVEATQPEAKSLTDFETADTPEIDPELAEFVEKTLTDTPDQPAASKQESVNESDLGHDVDQQDIEHLTIKPLNPMDELSALDPELTNTHHAISERVDLNEDGVDFDESNSPNLQNHKTEEKDLTVNCLDEKEIESLETLEDETLSEDQKDTLLG